MLMNSLDLATGAKNVCAVTVLTSV